MDTKDVKKDIQFSCKTYIHIVSKNNIGAHKMLSYFSVIYSMIHLSNIAVAILEFSVLLLVKLSLLICYIHTSFLDFSFYSYRSYKYCDTKIKQKEIKSFCKVYGEQ